MGDLQLWSQFYLETISAVATILNQACFSWDLLPCVFPLKCKTNILSGRGFKSSKKIGDKEKGFFCPNIIFALTHSLFLSLSLSFYLSHTYANTHIFSSTHFFKHSLTLSFFLSLSFLSLTHTGKHTHTHIFSSTHFFKHKHNLSFSQKIPQFHML